MNKLNFFCASLLLAGLLFCIALFLPRKTSASAPVEPAAIKAQWGSVTGNFTKQSDVSAQELTDRIEQLRVSEMVGAMFEGYTRGMLLDPEIPYQVHEVASHQAMESVCQTLSESDARIMRKAFDKFQKKLHAIYAEKRTQVKP